MFSYHWIFEIVRFQNGLVGWHCLYKYFTLFSGVWSSSIYGHIAGLHKNYPGNEIDASSFSSIPSWETTHKNHTAIGDNKILLNLREEFIPAKMSGIATGANHEDSIFVSERLSKRQMSLLFFNYLDTKLENHTKKRKHEQNIKWSKNKQKLLERLQNSLSTS